MKLIFLILGHLSLILGILGMFLPLLPTTPFLLLATFFYSRSSQKIHQWITEHKYFGPPINDWEKNGVIALKTKIIATIMILLVVFFKILGLATHPFIIYGIIAVLFLVLLFIWTRPSR